MPYFLKLLVPHLIQKETIQSDVTVIVWAFIYLLGGGRSCRLWQMLLETISALMSLNILASCPSLTTAIKLSPSRHYYGFRGVGNVVRREISSDLPI